MLAQLGHEWPTSKLASVQRAVACNASPSGSHVWVIAEPMPGYPLGTPVSLPRNAVVMSASGSSDDPRSALVTVRNVLARICEVPVDSFFGWVCERSRWLEHACQEGVAAAMPSQRVKAPSTDAPKAPRVRSMDSLPPLPSISDDSLSGNSGSKKDDSQSTSRDEESTTAAEGCQPGNERKFVSFPAAAISWEQAATGTSVKLASLFQSRPHVPAANSVSKTTPTPPSRPATSERPSLPESANFARGRRRLQPSRKETVPSDRDGRRHSLTEDFVKAVLPIEKDDQDYPLRKDRTSQIIQELRAVEDDSPPAVPVGFSACRSYARPYEPHLDFLHTIASPSTSLFRYTAAVVAEVVHNLRAERCSVYFVDDIRKELWCVGSLDMESFSMPIDKGIAGHVACSGELLNIKDVCSHKAFDSTVQTLTGYKAKTMLCAPIKHMINEKRTIGVIQVLNKLGKQSPLVLEQDAVFTEQDSLDLLKISELIGDSFHRQRWKALESGPSRGDREALSMIAAYCQGDRADQQPTTPGNGALTHVDDSVMHPNKSLDAFNWSGATLRSLNFNALSHSPEELIHFVPIMMQCAGCADSCLTPETLHNWSRGARLQYRDNPFHSWFHAFGVFHNCFYQLYMSNIAKYFRFLDVFALLVAALCHDLDHPGYTNSYLIDSQNELALRYNDVSVLENHHAALACELLRGETTRIAATLDSASQHALRRSVIRCILDTDMSHHSSLCQKMHAFKPADATVEDRKLLLSMCLHTADLSAQTQGWDLALQWEERVAQEFSNQAHAEREAGREPAPYMNFQMDDLKQRGKLQRDFIDFVLVPMWGPYTDLMLDLRRCFDNLVHNRGLYNHRAVHGNDSEN